MESKYFPGNARIATPEIAAKCLGTTKARLANDRARKCGYPYLKQNVSVKYDLDACYEFGLEAGSGRHKAA